MFCEKCGNKLPENALFCDECGSKVTIPVNGNTGQKAETKENQKQSVSSASQETAGQPVKAEGNQEQPAQQSIQTPGQSVQQPDVRTNAKPIPLITKVLALEAIVFVICAFICYTKVKEYMSPEVVAKSYFTAVMAGDVKKAYDLIDVEESEFVNEKYFGEFLIDIGQKSVRNYQVNSVKNANSGTGNSRELKITYRLKEDTSDYTFFVELEKSSVKKYFIFDDWKINIGKYISKDVEFEVNPDSKVELDGTELDKKYLSSEKEDSGLEKYVIPKMFNGTYQVLVTSDIYTDSKMVLGVQDDGDIYFEGEDGENDVEVKPEIVESVAKQSQEDFKKLWSNAVQQADFGNVKDIQMAEDTSEIKEEYEELLEKFRKEDGAGLQEMNFGDFEVAAKSGDEDDVAYPIVYVDFSASFSTISLSKDWWSGELESSDGSGEYGGNMSYAYQNGKWVLSDMSIASFYY